jgi:hypothetical protein
VLSQPSKPHSMTSVVVKIGQDDSYVDYSTVGLVPLFNDEYSDDSDDKATSNGQKVGMNNAVLKQITIDLDEQMPTWMRYYPHRMTKLAKENTSSFSSSSHSTESTESTESDLDSSLHSSGGGIPIVPFGMNRQRTLSSSSHGSSSHGKRSGKAVRRGVGSTLRSTPYADQCLKKSRTCFADLCTMADDTTTTTSLVANTSTEPKNASLMRGKMNMSSPDLLRRRANTAEVAMLFSFANLS